MSVICCLLEMLSIFLYNLVYTIISKYTIVEIRNKFDNIQVIIIDSKQPGILYLPNSLSILLGHVLCIMYYVYAIHI